MKTVKFTLSVLIALCLCVCVVSCGEDYSSPLKGQTVSDQIFEPGTNSKTVTIGTIDLSNCAVSSSSNWCSATIQASTVIITVQPNDTYEERQAKITLTDPEDGTILSFKVTQKQNNVILVDKPDYLIPEDGGEISIKVQSNVSYSVEIPSDASWLTRTSSSTRGLESSTIVLKADKNNTGDERGTIIKLIDQETETITQFTVKQELTPNIELSKEDISLFEDGGEFEIKVKSNISLTMSFSDNWIISNGRSDENGFSFVEKFKVSSLSSNQSSRNATIIFSDKIEKWKMSKTVKVKQIRCLAFEEEKLEMFVYDTYSLTLNNNTGQSVSWKSSNTSVATVNSKGMVTAVGKGSVTITATTDDGKYSAKIDIKVKLALYISSKDVSINIGDSYKLNYTNNTDQDLVWESSNSSVAIVDGQGVVTGVDKGTATIKVSTADGRRTDQTTVNVLKKVVYKAEAVDLGLSVLWSAYNLGAENPESIGACFAWGETSQKSTYNQNNYLYYDNNMQQYIFIGKDISGTQYDAAAVNLGGNWRMPTRDEMTELLKKCSWTWIQVNGMNGFKVTGNNGNSIFMPAAGGAGFNQDGKYLRYYTSTQYSLGYVLSLVLDSSFFGSADFGFDQYNGFAIRPVKSK